MSENQSSKRQKSVLGPVDDDAFGPDDNATSPLQLKRQDTLPEMESEVQDADSWSSNAKEYLDLATKVPIVQYFSDTASQLLLDEGASHLVPGCSFLDVCAGPGTYAFTVMKLLGPERAKDLRFTITDFSSGMIDAAKEVASKMQPVPTNINFEVVDVQNICLPDNHSDVVGCMFGYFVPDRKKAWSEVCRVCKPGGIAVIGTWKYAAFAFILEDFLKFLGRVEPYMAKMVAHVCADKESLKQEILAAGFSKVTVHDQGKIFEMPQTNELVMALFNNPMCKMELVKYSPSILLAEWKKFLLSTVDTYHYDEKTNILPVEYVANVVIAVK